ncbi:hypothetical protein BMAJHU_C0069 [Burkholderia mallei JHU]|nr:hypothetical protein BMAFMH_C0069 [Burkholderia mallei FMH]EDK60074.1 hypothetical protein BMAJHU_C0069 [Burkholderia mallei JHU]EDP88472.1 hypothetical protein BMA10399_E0067 [Burkholderia mallei ATCC 10399]EEP86194.1 hypothetical protein BMAGB8_0606 [Burkholderia mallei GB8 horse 4]
MTGESARRREAGGGRENHERARRRHARCGGRRDGGTRGTMPRAIPAAASTITATSIACTWPIRAYARARASSGSIPRRAVIRQRMRPVIGTSSSTRISASAPIFR